MPLALRLAGRFDPLLLGRALGEVVRRHEILRTRFPEVDGRPVQLIDPPLPPPLPVVDLVGLGGTAAAADARRIAESEASRPFDLAEGPLVRALLVRTGESEHQFLLTLHHIVADGWSLGVLARELEALSDAFARSRPSPLPDLPVQYADYATWQRGRLTGERLAERIAAWRERLAGAPEILDLPTDRPRPPVLGTRGGRRRDLLPTVRLAEMEAFARREGVTLFMVLLAGYAALLSRLSHQEDLVIGTPVAGRDHSELQGLIGCFVNTLALRLDVAERGPGGTPAFRDLVRRAREVILDAWTHQDLPFEKLVEALGLRRSLSHAPLFQTMLVLQSFPLAPPRLPGVETGLIEVDTGAARLDLTLAFFPVPGGLATEAEFHADLYEGSTAARLLRGFGAFLAGAVAEPDRRVGELPVLDEAERWQVLVEWNREAAQRSDGEALVHELFLAQAESTPAAPALVVGSREWSYAGLREEALRIASRLRRLGVGPEVRVGIFLDRGAELVPALLGTLLSGGAYVPLDPAYPEERIRFMLEDSGAAAVLTRRDLAGRLPATAPARLVVDAQEDREAPDLPPARAACARNLAYLIYTSGSTGRPKGVAIEHASAVELLVWARRIFSDSELSGVVAATSISFDLSVFEIFVPLAWGGMVMLVDNALEIARLDGSRARLVNTVPSAVAELLRGGGLPASVETVNLAGEALAGSLVRELYAAGVARVYNLYGPSEDTTYSTWALVSPGEPHPEIGRPVSGTRAYVLDQALEPVPLGMPGELYLGGAGLARCYLGRPKLTAERFLPDGLSGEPGERLYRTGDLVRHRPDGRLDYLGRLDQQVKVRGFRVELGEVEATLASFPGVEECAVLAQGEGAGKRLVAFVAPGPVDAAALQRHVRSRLPEHMVPALVEVLDALPLTPNGKVDRRALGRRTVSAPAAGAPAALRTPVAEVLAGIWAEVLGTEGAGAEDDFFSLGGHSLIATRVVARVREVLGVELQLRELFERPRLAELADRVEELRRPGDAAPLPPLRPVDRAADLPLSFAQERLWFLHRLEGGAAYNMPLALRLAGRFDPLLLGRALGEVVRRHEVLRTRFTLRNGELRQVIDPASPAPLPLVDLTTLPATARENETARLSAEEIRLPMDLEEGPVFRVRLLRLEPAEHRLLFTVHHIAFDGWSMSVLVRELGALYPALAAGRPSPLPELPIQYADYAAWQRGRLAGEALEQHLDYWRRALAGAPAGLDLPLDRPRPAAPHFVGGRLRRALAGDVVRGLEGAGRRRGATLYMALLATFGALLFRLSGQDDLVVGSPVAERTRVETEPLIGVLLNTLALRLDFSGEPTFEQLLDRVRETALGAYTHQDLPFERLLQEIRSERESGRAPLFQILFNMLSFPRATVELPDLSVEVLSAPELPARFDLTLYAMAPAETGGEVLLDLVWNADLFTETRAAGILDQLVALAEQAAAAPDERIGAYGLVTPDAAAVLPDPRQPLPAAWEGSIVERARQTALQDPERTAVRDAAGTRLTYGDLEARSNRIAHVLLAGGVGRGDVVAVWAHRSAGIVEALLGVWKAGAAFAVLDPSYPASRLVKSLEAAAPVAWLRLATAPPMPVEVQSFLAAGCRTGTDLSALGDGPLDGVPADDPGVRIGPDDLAYVAFTSGSTGTPKAILGTHSPLSHFLRWHAETFGLGPDDRFSLLSGLAHDPLLRDVFAPLWVGATLSAPDPDEMGTPGRMLAWMARERITVAHLTPVLGQWIADDGGGVRNGAALPELRHAFFGGDVLTRRDAARLTALAPSVLCVNFYGATETPQAMGFHVVAEAGTAEPGREIVPLGRGIEGVQLLVIGREGRLAGVGELGEIHVRTPYLSLGYRGDEEMTRVHFLPNPFTGSPGDRLYRTGDLGRFLPSGEVEFAGRADDQIKLRGFRIEPAEVEAALEQHPRVERAVVGVHEVDGGDRVLVAWFVPAGEEAPSAAELQGFMRERLPLYMVPSRLVALTKLPLTPNGKVDRRALPGPPAEGGDETDAPRSALEAALTDLWARTLGRPTVGVHDNFFALGGHSLLAARLLARVGEELGVTVPLRNLIDRPTVADLAQEVERLRRESPEAAAARLPIAVPDSERRHLPFPLTDIQHAYWVGRSSALELGNVASHRYLEIEGADLDLERFGEAWRRLIGRHDMLRALVRPDGLQVILPEVPAYEIAVEDLRGRDVSAVESRLAELRERMSHQVLATDRWPLFEIRACRLPEERTRLFFSFDYLIADAWSFRILIRELLALYADPAAALAPLDLSFRDYVLAEEELRRGEAWRRAHAYWEARRDELPPGPEFPLARSLGSLDRPRFARRAARLEPAAWARLRERATAAGVTPSGLLLAAFSEVLAAWSKSPRFTLVLTLFNRLPFHPQVDLLVGDFTSTSLLAIDASPGERFGDKVRRLQERLWEDLDHRYVSGVQVLRELSHGRGLARAAAPVVFTSTLGLRGLDGGDSEPDLPGKVVHSVSQTPQVLLDHQVSERGSALLWSWDAVEDLFPIGMLDDMFEAYGWFLGELAAGDGVPWDTAPSLTPPAHRILVATANATAASVSGALLHQLFAEQAQTGADRTAVVAPGRSISYGELRARSLDLGHRLRALGARPNQLVAVVMEKGWEQVVAVLGILEAGAAYLPIDAGLPPERLRQLLERGEVEVVVTQPWLESSIAWPAGVRCLRVGPEPPAGEREPLPPIQGPEDLAYVIFTSGSTGVPKGVMIDHRGAVNTILDVNRRFAVGPEDRVFALSALSFDLSVYDIFGLLAAGGAVVFPEAGAQRDPSQWSEILDHSRVTLWNSVPALMEMLVDYCEVQRRPLPGTLRTVLLSGDWIPVTLPDRIRTLAARVELVSMGGATEASIWSILYPIGPVDPAWKSIPYGRAMVNQSFFVLDAALEPRPVWVPGELWIGGIGVAKGYWRDCERTMASFVTHPRTGERLYRTGDLGRLLPDGNLEFLGREDFQIKVHGYRIELGEIEAVLGDHAGVKAAVVQAVGEGRTNRRLVAWVVPAGEVPPTLGELRDFLRSQLPEYMVPTSFGYLQALPLTPNGKVDRTTLPAPAAADVAPAPQAGKELSPLARRIVGVIAGVLRTDAVDLEADLFALGASSVEMVRIANLLEIELGFRPRMDELLTLSRIGALVEFYERRLTGADDFEAMPEEGTGTPVFAPISDPAERERFKANEPGLRRLDGAGAIALVGSEPPSRYAARRSHREFAAEPLAAERLGRWLAGLRRSTLDAHPKYLYGSAGGLYPVQVYLYARDGRVEGVPPGPYYYHPTRHELAPLTPLTEGAALRRSDYGWVNQPTFDRAAFALFFIGDLRAIGPMYGASSRDFCLIEAGLIAQLLEERAPLQRIGVCQIGRCRVAILNDLFRLEPGHVFLHGLLGGGLPSAVPELDAAARGEAAGEDGGSWEEGEI
jgi:amino acid adenylation domain-containing protein